MLLALALCAAAVHAQERPALDRIVAVVGNEIITESELALQSAQVAMQNRLDPSDTTVRRRVLDAIINEKLILAQAQLDSVSVTEDEITQALDQQIQYLQTQYGTRERLEQAAGMPLSKIKQEFREDIRNRLMIDRLKQSKFGDVAISRREVEEFYTTYKDSLPFVSEQVELRQIVKYPKVTESYKANARKKIEAILDSLKAGGDFSKLARTNSDDAGSSRNGGDLGLVRRGIFVKEFEEAAFALDPGQVSGIIETQFGFHIIKLLEKKGEAIRPQHILIRVAKTGESDSLVLETMNALRDRILKGEDFASIAKEHSEDEETRPYGGAMGVIEVPRLSDELHQAEQTMSPGDVSKPIRLKLNNDYAYTMIQLVRRIQPHAASLANDYQRIEQLAKVYKQNRLYSEWLAKIKHNIYCDVKI